MSEFSGALTDTARRFPAHRSSVLLTSKNNLSMLTDLAAATPLGGDVAFEALTFRNRQRTLHAFGVVDGMTNAPSPVGAAHPPA